MQDRPDVTPSPRRLDQIDVQFNDPGLISDAGLLLCATLADRLGVEELVNESVWLGHGVAGACLPGRKVMTLIHGMLAGGDSIDDMNVLRAGGTETVLGHRVMAPSTLGTFLRAFTFGYVRQLDHVLDVVITRAWAQGLGPGELPLVLDMDSFVGEVYGYAKHGAGYGYTHKLGYHPLVATRADTGEVIHIRNRTGSANTQRGAERFVDELLARVRRAGHRGPVVLRADNGFENHQLIKTLDRQGVEFSIGAKQSKTIRALIAEIPDTAWVPVSDYSPDGEAQITETSLKGWRLIVHRTRLTDPEQLALWPDWRHHAFLTNRTVPLTVADIDHRDHAQIELVIRDFKDQALAHFPSGHMHANSAWTVIAALAHNIARWSTLMCAPNAAVQTARTRRDNCFAFPAGSSGPPVDGRCVSQPAGPGRPPTSHACHRSGRSRSGPDRSTVPRDDQPHRQAEHGHLDDGQTTPRTSSRASGDRLRVRHRSSSTAADKKRLKSQDSVTNAQHFSGSRLRSCS